MNNESSEEEEDEEEEEEENVTDMNSDGYKFLFLSIFIILFFIASAYGVQRTILSTFAGENIPLSLWFETGAWLSVAFTLAGFGLFKSLSGFFTGAYTKKLGTRNIVILGVFIFTIGLIPLLFSQGNPTLLGIGNSFLGAGEGILYAGAMTYISDLSTQDRRGQLLGVMELSVYAGYSLGAISAGFITVIANTSTASFLFSILVASIGLGLSIATIKPIKTTETQRIVKELRTPLKYSEIPISFREILTRPTLIVTFLIGHISKMIDSIIVLFLPLILSSESFGYGLTIQETGIITAVFTLSWALTMPFAGRISDWIGRKKPIFFGLVLEMLAILGIQWGSSPFIFIFILSALGGLGVGLYYPILPSISVDVAPDAEKSKLIGIYRSIKDLGYFTGPLAAGIVAQIWYNTNPRLNIVLRVPLSFTCLLLFISALIIFLVRETHPGWAQFQSTLQHASIVEKCVVQVSKGLLVYLEQESIEDSEFQSRLARYTLRAKELEIEADRKLEEIVEQSYRTLHSSPDTSSFLRIARRLDRVAGLSLGALYRIQNIPIEEIPPFIQEKLHNASVALRSLVLTSVDVLKILKIKLDAVTGMYYSTRELESELDLLYQMMNRHLFLSAKQMHYGTWYAIKDVVNMIEQAADSAEDAVEVINILAIKYKT